MLIDTIFIILDIFLVEGNQSIQIGDKCSCYTKNGADMDWWYHAWKVWIISLMCLKHEIKLYALNQIFLAYLK